MRQQKGFTLIELMIVIAIIGILAAVALPAYSRYTIKAKGAEVVLALTTPRQAISEVFQMGSMTTIGALTGLEMQTVDNPTEKVTQVTVSAAGVVTVVANSANLGAAMTLQLTPSVDSATLRTLKWRCSATAGAKYAPGSCR